MSRPPNVMGVYGNFIGTAAMGFNQCLEAEVYATSSLEPYTWEGNVLTLYTPRIGQGIYDHIHYDVRTDGSTPTLEEMKDAYVWDTDILVLNLPEASGIVVHAVAHDIFHRTKESDDDITEFGEYWVDLTPPTGRMLIDGGAPQTLDQTVSVRVIASDIPSGLAQMYFSGDCQGVNVDRWITFNEYTDIQVSDIEGLQTITCRLKDHAGNVSQEFWASIIYPLVRYFFQKAAGRGNKLTEKREILSVTTHNMREGDNKMEEASPHGNLTGT